MIASRELRRAFDRIYDTGERVAPFLDALLPPSQGDPRVLGLRSTAFLTTAVLARLEATCRSLAPILPQPSRILDLGCGRARLGLHLASLAKGTMVGVDLSWEALATARLAAPHTGFVLADSAALPFADGCFELVLAVDVLHLVPDLSRTLAEVRRVTHHDGALLATIYERAGSFGATRDDDQWRSAIAAAGFGLTSWTDTSDEWRVEMRARHQRRWDARRELSAQLGADAVPYLEVTRQMLGSASVPGFIATNRRWELVARTFK